MKLVKGNKIEDLSATEFEKIKQNFEKVEIDLGTGDGKFLLKKALENKNILYIGIEPAEKQLIESSKKANKNRLDNLIFVIGSIEVLPKEICNIADVVYINLPWGTLLEKVIKPSEDSVLILSNLLKKGGKLEILIGYSHDFEPSETKRLDLPEIDLDYIENVVIPVFEAGGFEKNKVEKLDNQALKEVQTSWAKRLGKEREFYKLILVSNQE